MICAKHQQILSLHFLDDVLNSAKKMGSQSRFQLFQGRFRQRSKTGADQQTELQKILCADGNREFFFNVLADSLRNLTDGIVWNRGGRGERTAAGKFFSIIKPTDHNEQMQQEIACCKIIEMTGGILVGPSDNGKYFLYIFFRKGRQYRRNPSAWFPVSCD